MKSLVTGAAGFIGSHLSEKLLREGHEVYGVDKFLDNYARPFKERNLSALMADPRFHFIEEDLLRLDLAMLLDGISYIFHLAGQPGVRASWGREFDHYTHNNILATQRLLEACKGIKIDKFVYASSSSVYGDTEDLPMREQSKPSPVSPYGVSKLAAEHLCYLYWTGFGIPTVSLRYFTVYGPRQRPDMFFHILMRALVRGEEIPLYGNGSQSRDFTYCSDIVEGTLAASAYPGAGEVFNLGGGARSTLVKIIEMLEQISGKKAKLKRMERQRGDVGHTEADLARARERLGFRPKVGLAEGLERQWSWLSQLAL